MAAVQRDEHPLKALSFEIRQVALRWVEAMRIHTLALQRGQHATAAHQ